jgi:hypothetical protein
MAEGPVFGAKQPFVGIDKGRGPARVVVRSDQRFVRLENARSRASVMRPRLALSEACRHPLVLGAAVKRGSQPGAGSSLGVMVDQYLAARDELEDLPSIFRKGRQTPRTYAVLYSERKQYEKSIPS